MIKTKKVRIGDLVDIRRGASPRPIDEWLSKSGVPWVKISDATQTDSKYIYSTVDFIKEEGKNRSVEVHPGDLIISNSATPALPKIMMIDACVHDGWLVPYNYKNITRDYLFYIIKYYRKFLLNQGNGSIFKNLKTDILKDFEVFIPINKDEKIDIKLQEKQIKPLLILDKLIEENLQVIKKNNEQLKFIYNYYFNNICKSDYKFECLKIKDVIAHINTGLNPRDNFKFDNKSKIKYITVKNLTTNGLLDYNSCDRIDEQARKIIHERSMIDIGDILFSSIAPIGRCFLIYDEPKDWDINESVFSVRPNSLVSPEYLYMYLKSDEFIKKAENLSTGSIFSGIRVNTLQDIDIVVPCKKILDEFTSLSKPIMKLNNQKSKEIEKLNNLKEFLLPLLLDGEVTINE